MQPGNFQGYLSGVTNENVFRVTENTNVSEDFAGLSNTRLVTLLQTSPFSEKKKKKACGLIWPEGHQIVTPGTIRE